jgi:hypothetical protein
MHKVDERVMDQWKKDHPEDVEAKVIFFAAGKVQRKEERAKNRRKKAFTEVQLASPSMIPDNDDKWLDLSA